MFIHDGNVMRVKYLLMTGFFLVLRGGAVALESSGMPTVPNNLRSQTPDRSSITSDNRRVRVSNWYTHKATHWGKLCRLNCYFNNLILCWICVCMQPDGAESIASVHSSDSAPEKKATGHHRTNSDAPTISVSRASVSSGTSSATNTLLFCFTLKWHAVVSASQLTHKYCSYLNWVSAVSYQRWQTNQSSEKILSCSSTQHLVKDEILLLSGADVTSSQITLLTYTPVTACCSSCVELSPFPFKV